MNKDIEVTLLSKEEIRKFKVLKKVGRECSIPYWTRSMSSNYESWNNVYYILLITSIGGIFKNKANEVHGIRPVLKTNNLEKLIKDLKISYENGVEVVEYGEYPNLEEKFYTSNSSKPTGKSYYYPCDASRQNNYRVDEFLEYQYYGTKFAHLKYGFYEVMPIKFYIDREYNMLIAKDVLFEAPINIDNKNYNGDFETSQLYHFLNNEFINSLLPNPKNNEMAALIRKKEILEKEIETKIKELKKLKKIIQENEELKTQNNSLNSEIENSLKGPSKVLKK